MVTHHFILWTTIAQAFDRCRNVYVSETQVIIIKTKATRLYSILWDKNWFILHFSYFFFVLFHLNLCKSMFVCKRWCVGFCSCIRYFLYVNNSNANRRWMIFIFVFQLVSAIRALTTSPLCSLSTFSAWWRGISSSFTCRKVNNHKNSISERFIRSTPCNWTLTITSMSSFFTWIFCSSCSLANFSAASLFRLSPKMLIACVEKDVATLLSNRLGGNYAQKIAPNGKAINLTFDISADDNSFSSA